MTHKNMDQYDILIGVDGGGTKTKAEVEDITGKQLGTGKGGPANIRSSVPQAWKSIQHAVTEALQQANLRLDDPHYRFHIGLGLAGTEVPEAIEEFMQASQDYPYRTLVLNSDAYAACLGVHGGHDGAIIIIGTGTIGYQIEEGRVSRVGGWGFPHSDEGGGAWLGMEASRLTFQWLDKRISPTPLLRAIFERFNRDVNQFTTWAVRAGPAHFGELVPLIMEYLQKEDPHAINLIKGSAKCTDLLWRGLRNQATTALPCCLLGGVAPFIQPYLDKNLLASLVPRQYDAPKGAILMLRQHLELPENE